MSDRSATRPAHAPRMRIGPNWPAVSRPIAMPLPVRCSTSSTSAIDVSHVPTWEMSCPVKNSRKLRTPSEANVVRSARLVPRITAPSSHSTTRSRMSAARERVSTSAGSSLSSRIVSHAVRRARRASIRRRPAAVIATQTTRPSESSARRSTRPAAASFSMAPVTLGFAESLTPCDVPRRQRPLASDGEQDRGRPWGTDRPRRAGEGCARAGRDCAADVVRPPPVCSAGPTWSQSTR